MAVPKTLIESNFFISRKDYDAAYDALCDLNKSKDFDDLKSQGKEKEESNIIDLCKHDPRPEGMNHHPARWFEGMDPDYPSKLKSVMDILEALGIECEDNEDGLRIIDCEYNRNEDLMDFFNALVKIVKDDTYILWRYENYSGYDSIVAWKFKNGCIDVKIAQSTWEQIEDEDLNDMRHGKDWSIYGFENIDSCILIPKDLHSDVCSVLRNLTATESKNDTINSFETFGFEATNDVDSMTRINVIGNSPKEIFGSKIMDAFEALSPFVKKESYQLIYWVMNKQIDGKTHHEYKCTKIAYDANGAYQWCKRIGLTW